MGPPATAFCRPVVHPIHSTVAVAAYRDADTRQPWHAEVLDPTTYGYEGVQPDEAWPLAGGSALLGAGQLQWSPLSPKQIALEEFNLSWSPHPPGSGTAANAALRGERDDAAARLAATEAGVDAAVAERSAAAAAELHAAQRRERLLHHPHPTPRHRFFPIVALDVKGGAEARRRRSARAAPGAYFRSRGRRRDCRGGLDGRNAARLCRGSGARSLSLVRA
jgi:hypothetical protein